ncbi:hypothetical protein CH333_01760 [candidate division WOR-3 bacterium JGI_Cruoil_03_44_89]|uniref:site-specific DNA-methyltransferase (adenine-specific) n=1 Tax=candidate division WOR-3 bacterium JGI_Cruoil_03_44_89 TaxID=1973748 RepID=A0A235C043_UNCW3|nr:MAG: hypothetical protein CH333_01760 [candidate division WOR-3 bacterium JGI_Cruoil_03_44_89]
MKQIRTKSDTDFILKVMSVLEGFQYKGKKYLSYMETCSRGDEFLIRDNIVKPFFTDVLGYDKQKDFVPEEIIETGKPDTQIVDATGNPVIVIETLSSGADDRQFEEHRKRLFDYTDELSSKIAVLTNGIVFNAFWNRGRGKAKDRLVLLKFDEIYKKFVLKGMEGLDSVDWERLLTLKYLVKELQIIDPEQLYKEPEFGIAEETHFSKFLEQLINSMEQVKMNVKNQFELYLSKNEEYEELRKNRERNGRPIYQSESRQYELPRRCVQSFKKWQSISSANREPETFQLETMYIFFNRILLLRICEDKGIIEKRRISNGGIQDWMTFKGFTHFSEVNYNEMVKDAYKVMEKTYPHLFREDIFDWYMPNNELLLGVLFTFNPYNFKQVDRDILGKLYERYIPREERKRLGQFYTPEEVINYILDAVGYREDADIEGKRLLDPACGSGGFLVRAANVLIQRLNVRGFGAETILNKVQENIYGFEINPFACHLAETNLLFQVIDLIKEAKKENSEFEMGRFNVFETDSLRIPKKEGPKLFKEYNSEWFEDAETVRQIKLKEGKFKDGFDFVVGNPPYLKANAPQGEVLRIRREIEKQKYFNTLFEKWDLYIPFVEVGFDLTKESGRFSFIVSDAYRTADYGMKSREMLLTQSKITQLDFFKGLRLFDDPQVENVIFVIDKRFPTKAHRVKRMEHLNKRNLYDFKSLKSLNQLQDKESVFYIEARKPLMSKVKILPLNDICYISIGMVLNSDEKKYKGEFKKEDLISQTQGDIHSKPFIEGKDIGRYEIKRVRFLEWGTGRVPAKVRRPTFLELHENEKIVVGETSGAAYDNAKLYCDQSVRIFIPYHKLKGIRNNTLNRRHIQEKIRECNEISKQFDLKYILALLNSKILWHHFLSNISRRGERIICPDDWRNFPIGVVSPKTQQEFIYLVNEFLEINKMFSQCAVKVNNIQKLIEDFDIPLGDLADISGIRLELKERIGRPKIKRKGLKIYLDRKSNIECENGALAEYIELYLISLSDTLRGKTKPELVKLIQIPKSVTQVKAVLDKRKELKRKLENLARRRGEIDKEIDKKVYKLYGLTEKEIKMIKEEV